MRPHLINVERGLALSMMHIFSELAKHRDEADKEEDEVVETDLPLVPITADDGLEDLVANTNACGEKRNIRCLLISHRYLYVI